MRAQEHADEHVEVLVYEIPIEPSQSFASDLNDEAASKGDEAPRESLPPGAIYGPPGALKGPWRARRGA